MWVKLSGVRICLDGGSYKAQMGVVQTHDPDFDVNYDRNTFLVEISAMSGDISTFECPDEDLAHKICEMIDGAVINGVVFLDLDESIAELGE